MEIKMEKKLWQKGFIKTHISKNVHIRYCSDFAEINFNKWTKTSRFKMAAMLKMVTKNGFSLLPWHKSLKKCFSFVSGPQITKQKCHQIFSMVKFNKQNFHFSILSQNFYG
jgi:hypothetical protein